MFVAFAYPNNTSIHFRVLHHNLLSLYTILIIFTHGLLLTGIYSHYINFMIPFRMLTLAASICRELVTSDGYF